MCIALQLMGPLEMACFQVFEPARSEEMLWHAHDVYRVLKNGWIEKREPKGELEEELGNRNTGRTTGRER